MYRGYAFKFSQWMSLIWLMVWLPTYAIVWGWGNFLHLCNVAVFLSCLGFLLESSLLVSSQSLILLMGCLLWAVDVGSKVLTGSHLFGGTEYLWNHQIPLWVRCLSFYHLLLPVLLLVGISRFGYDRRALKWQGGISLIVLSLSRFTNPAQNINFVFAPPLFGVPWKSAIFPVLVNWISVMGFICWPTHWMLSRFLKPPRRAD